MMKRFLWAGAILAALALPVAAATVDTTGSNSDQDMVVNRDRAEQGDPVAQNSLGVIYARQRNYIQAYKWLSLSIQGSEPGAARHLAEQNLAVVIKKLKVEELEEARRLVREFKPAKAKRPRRPAD